MATPDIIPLCLAVLLGGAIGIERERRGRAAGLRTMIMVCLGATLVMLVSERLAFVYGTTTSDQALRVDPARIAAGIVTGVGFLGAGVVIKIEDMTRGVTTAAAIWFVAAIGIALGSHRYELAIAATAMAFGVLALLKIPDRWLRSHVYRMIHVVTESARAERVLEAVRSVLDEQGARLMDLKAREDLSESQCELTFYVRLTQRFQAYDVLKRMREIEGVRQLEWK